jgi:hypothetical protein
VEESFVVLNELNVGILELLRDFGGSLVYDNNGQIVRICSSLLDSRPVELLCKCFVIKNGKCLE